MNHSKIPPTVSPRRFAWSAAFLCIGCCAIVPILILIGVTSAVSLGIYFEFAAAGFFIASVVFFGYPIFKNKRRFCDKNCACKDTSA